MARLHLQDDEVIPNSRKFLECDGEFGMPFESKWWGKGIIIDIYSFKL